MNINLNELSKHKVEVSMDDVELAELIKVLFSPDSKIPEINKRGIKMGRTEETIKRFCETCCAMSLDMTKCDYCEFRYICYTQ